MWGKQQQQWLVTALLSRLPHPKGHGSVQPLEAEAEGLAAQQWTPPGGAVWQWQVCKFSTFLTE
jgi:hypothetical protein